MNRGLGWTPVLPGLPNAMRRAGETLKQFEFRGATLYSTLQPCGMCTMASIWAKIGRIIDSAGPEDVHRMYFVSRPS